MFGPKLEGQLPPLPLPFLRPWGFEPRFFTFFYAILTFFFCKVKWPKSGEKSKIGGPMATKVSPCRCPSGPPVKIP